MSEASLALTSPSEQCQKLCLPQCGHILEGIRVLCERKALITLFRRTQWRLYTETSTRHVMSSKFALSGSQVFHCLLSHFLSPPPPFKSKWNHRENKSLGCCSEEKLAYPFCWHGLCHLSASLTRQYFFSPKFRGILLSHWISRWLSSEKEIRKMGKNRIIIE